jgi:hypothetical protein
LWHCTAATKQIESKGQLALGRARLGTGALLLVMDAGNSVGRAANRQRMLLNHLRPVSDRQTLLACSSAGHQGLRALLRKLLTLVQGMEQSSEAMSHLQVPLLRVSAFLLFLSVLGTCFRLNDMVEISHCWR